MTLATSPRTGMTRAESYEWAVALRASGKSYKQIAVELCCSASYVRDLFFDPDGSKARERKQRCLRKPCTDCGALTWGERCHDCQAIHMQSEEWAAALTKWPAELVIARIQEWARLYGTPPAMGDWNAWQADVYYHDHERARRFDEAAGHWPWFTVVVNRFGSWNAGIRAAGFEPRPARGTVASGTRRRNKRAAA